MKKEQLVQTRLTILRLMAILCLASLGSGCDQKPTNSAAVQPAASPTAPIDISVSEDGRLTKNITLNPTDDGFKEVHQYMTSCTTAGGELRIEAFAPGIVLQTPTVRINIGKSFVIVSTRTDVTDTWNQRSLPRTSRDNDVIEFIRSK